LAGGRKQRVFSSSNKIPIIVVSSFIIAALLVTAFTNRQVDQAKARIIDEKERALEATASRVELRFQDAVKVLEFAALQPQVAHDPDASLISEELKGIPEGADPEMRGMARDLMETHKDFDYMFFAMPNGDIYMLEPYSQQLDLPQLNFAFRDWFGGATSTQQTYISEAYISANNRHKVVAIAVPIYSEELKGLWVGALDLTAVQEKLRETQLGENESVLIVDHNGNTVADSTQTDFAFDLQSALGIEGVAKALAGEQGSQNQAIGGTDMFVSYMPFAVGSHTWALVSMQPNADAFAAAQRISLQSAATLVLLVIISAVSGFFLYRSSRSNAKLAGELEGKNEELSSTNMSLQVLNGLLERQKEKLAEVDKAKDEFSAMITHELKTPLVPIIGYSELLMDGSLGELTQKQREKIQIMHHSANSLLRLISDLLDARKLELGQMKFSIANNVSAETIVKECMNSVLPLAEARGVALEYRAQDAKLKCDQKRIDQVLHNLLTNAIKFVPERTGRIEIYVEKSQDGQIVFAVKDNGTGIPAAKQQHLFKKFYQADTSMSRNAGGTGLGLTISKGIVEAHGGKIWFESQEGAGSTFYFTVPESAAPAIEENAN
jgi:signal transduction histidine kinase